MHPARRKVQEVGSGFKARQRKQISRYHALACGDAGKHALWMVGSIEQVFTLAQVIAAGRICLAKLG